MQTLTPKQKQILDFITDYTEKNGYSPSLDEISRKFKRRVPTIFQHIESLKAKGFLLKTSNISRGIQLNTAQDEVMLLGLIAAGQPIEPIENPDPIKIPTGMINKPGNYYALQVKGDSMIEEGIADEDIIVIRHQKTADNGDVVIAITEKGATLKKFRKKNGSVFLEPRNKEYNNIFPKSLEIRGVLLGLIRSINSSKSLSSPIISKIIANFPFTNNSTRISTESKEAKPFIQWVGGKREMIPQYKPFIPNKYRTYFEPFLGGGAMFFHLKPKNAILSDNNLMLIKTYEGVRDNPDKVISILKLLKQKHSKELYMEIRNIDRKFNILEDLESAEIAARFIYLNQTGFNGVYRVNKKDQFNVPIGSSLNRLICDKNNLLKVSAFLKSITIKYADFDTIINSIGKDDFVYLDPPYYPVSKYSDFTRYTKEKFYKEDQARLKRAVDVLSRKGTKVMLSNSDCEFIKNLYKKYIIKTVYSSRTLNSKKDRRGKITELLILNY